MVADHEGAHPRTYRLDHTGRLVAQHHRRERRKSPSSRLRSLWHTPQCGDPDHDLAAVGVLDVHVVVDPQEEAPASRTAARIGLLRSGSTVGTLAAPVRRRAMMPG